MFPAMRGPESFRDRSFRFALHVLRFYRRLTSSSDVPRHLATQMLRAGTSTGANVEEAQSAYSRRDLAARYTIGLREARECRYWIRLIIADQPQMAKQGTELIEECGHLVGVLSAAVRKLREPR
jgi:four helix bundle protein